MWSQCPLWVKGISLKTDIILSNIRRILWKVDQVIYIMYPNFKPNIMILAQAVYVTRMLYYTKCLSRTKDIIQPITYRILPKVNQVIYTLDTSCILNIMILAQAVLQIFMSQGCFTIQNGCQTRDIIQPNISKILPKVNEVIYTLDTICRTNIKILAQVVL